MSLAIYTAATTHRIAGLDLKDAEQLRQQIVDLVKVVQEDA